MGQPRTTSGLLKRKALLNTTSTTLVNIIFYLSFFIGLCSARATIVVNHRNATFMLVSIE